MFINRRFNNYFKKRKFYLEWNESYSICHKDMRHYIVMYYNIYIFFLICNNYFYIQIVILMECFVTIIWYCIIIYYHIKRLIKLFCLRFFIISEKKNVYNKCY